MCSEFCYIDSHYRYQVRYVVWYLVPGTRFNSYICTIPGTRVIGIPIWKIPVPVV